SALLKWIARWMMAVGLPAFATAILGAGAWFAGRIISATDENTRAVIELKQSMKSLVDYQIPGIVNTLNGRLDAHEQRLGAIDRRNELQDNRIEELQRRATWRLPEASAPAPAAAPSIRPYP